jgi:hypothetical protein
LVIGNALSCQGIYCTTFILYPWIRWERLKRATQLARALPVDMHKRAFFPSCIVSA